MKKLSKILSLAFLLSSLCTFVKTIPQHANTSINEQARKPLIQINDTTIDGTITKEGGIKLNRITIPSSALHPILFRNGGINYLILDCDNEFFSNSFTNFSVFIPGYDINQKHVAVQFVDKSNHFETHTFEIDDTYLNELITRAVKSSDEQKYRLLNIIGLENNYIIANTSNSIDTYNLRNNEMDFESLGTYKGSLTEYEDNEALSDTAIQYYDGLYPVSFDDNPIINLIPKTFFTYPTEKVLLGQEYGFYIRTTETNNSNRLLSHFLIFSTKHSRGEVTIPVSNTTDYSESFVSNLFSFELKPVIQGTMDYYRDIDTVCHFIETNNLCIDNPTFSYAFNNANGKFNDEDNWFIEKDNHSCYSINYRYSFVGQTKQSENYTPVFDYINTITNFLTKLPKIDPTLSLAIEIANDAATVINNVYQASQDNISDNYQSIGFSRNTSTNKLSSAKAVSYHINPGNILKENQPINQSFKGFSFSLDNTTKKYDDNLPILLKDKTDSFKFMYEISSFDNNNIFAQNIIDTISFNIKRDDSLFTKNKTTLLKSKNEIEKSWKLFYDPCAEFRTTTSLTLGKTYYLNYGKTTNEKNRSVEFSYTPFLAGDYYFITYGFLTNSIISVYDENNNEILSKTIKEQGKISCKSFSLKGNVNYSIIISGKNNDIGFTQFKCYYYRSSIYQQNISSPSSVAYATREISYLYSFTPYTLDKIRQNFLINTSQKETNNMPDTELSLLSADMEIISSSDNFRKQNNEELSTSSLFCNVKGNNQYYISLTLKNITANTSCYLSILAAQTLSPLKSDMIINYTFCIDKKTAYCFIVNPKLDGKYTFRVFGNDVNNDISSSLYQMPYSYLASRYKPSSEPIINHELNSNNSYLLIINHYFQYKDNTSKLQLNYWVN